MELLLYEHLFGVLAILCCLFYVIIVWCAFLFARCDQMQEEQHIAELKRRIEEDEMEKTCDKASGE